MILRTISVATVLALSVTLTACGTMSKDTTTASSAQVTLPTLSAAHLIPQTSEEATELSVEDWVQRAQNYFDSREYSRALRAANEALYLSPETTEARKIALLSTIRIVQNNSAIYHDKTLINDSQREEIKEGLTSITTLINAS